MQKLDSNRYDRIRPLMTQLAAYNVAIPALLDGNNPGAVFVDDPDTPRSAYIETVEGRHLVGDATNAAFISALQAHLAANRPSWGLDVTVDPAAWVDRLASLFQPHTVGQVKRRHYVCTALAYTNWRENLPDGFVAQLINSALLDDPQFDIPDHIHNWIEYNWGTRTHYEQHGFGFCVRQGDKVVSWSVADCVSGPRAEIGIHTRAEYRRQGLAAITAAACVEYALTQGFTEVGWHCHDDNIGSWKTAEKVGFQHERDYTLYYYR